MSDTVKITTSVEYRAWVTPNFVLFAMPPGKREDGFKESPSFPVEEVATEVIDALAKQWLDHLYAKLGRPSPFSIIQAGRP